LFANLIVNKCSLGIAIGQVITAGLDKKIFAWDTRMEKDKKSVFVKSLNSEVTSMSLSGLDMMVTMGESVYVCDLRNPQKPFESKDTDMNTPIICSSAIPYAKGIISVLCIVQHVVNHLHFILAQEDIMPYVKLFYIFELDRHHEF
jgi:WD40 repeat protein